MEEAITYNEQDGLVLAVVEEHHNYDITRWLAWMDQYRKVVLSYEELQTALEKLQRGGLIVCDVYGPYCTFRGKMLLLGRDKMNTVDWILRVQHKIQRWQFRDMAPVRYSLSEEKYERSREEYGAYLQMLLKRLYTQ
jgi:hypothetical protein